MNSDHLTHTLYITFISLGEQASITFFNKDGHETLPSPLDRHVQLYFDQGGRCLTVMTVTTFSDLQSLSIPEDVNIICCPELRNAEASVFGSCLDALYDLSRAHHAFLLIDPPLFISDIQQLKTWFLGDSFDRQKIGALYYPDMSIGDEIIPPSVLVSAMFEHNDRMYGLLRSPSGTTLPLLPEIKPISKLSNEDTLALNWMGINCVRHFSSAGTVLWGRKTVLGDDDAHSPWKYVFVVRTTQFISKAILSIDASEREDLFQELYQKGFFLGESLDDSYYLRQDSRVLHIGAKLLHKDHFIEWTLPIEEHEETINE